MSATSKRDLDGMLRTWPALNRDGHSVPAAGDEKRESTSEGLANEASEESWELRADRIFAAARSATGDAKALDAVFAKPDLSPEPGEPNVGEVMSSDSRDRSSSGSNETPSVPPVGGERKRTSLKEIAARASQSGRGSMPSNPTATPLPGRVSSPGPISTPPPSKVKRAVEATEEDSGVVNLHAVTAGATAEEVAAAERAKPATESLFEADKPKAAPKPAAAKAPPAPQAANSSKRGAIAGIAIAVFGLAAAIAIMQSRSKHDSVATKPADARPAAAEQAKPDSTGPAAAAKPEAVAAAPSNAGLDPDSLPEASSAKPNSGPVVAGGAHAPAAVAAAPDGKPAPVAAASPAPAGPPGDLKNEMRKAVGSDGKPEAVPDGVPEPAAGNPHNQNIPEQPSQGAVQSAIGAVLGTAKGCVSDADEVTTARVTFTSSGSVSSVTVTGWASANGKSGCVVSALKGAKVSPFSKPTYTFPVTIRP